MQKLFSQVLSCEIAIVLLPLFFQALNSHYSIFTFKFSLDYFREIYVVVVFSRTNIS